MKTIQGILDSFLLLLSERVRLAERRKEATGRCGIWTCTKVYFNKSGAPHEDYRTIVLERFSPSKQKLELTDVVTYGVSNIIKRINKGDQALVRMAELNERLYFTHGGVNEMLIAERVTS